MIAKEMGCAEGDRERALINARRRQQQAVYAHRADDLERRWAPLGRQEVSVHLPHCRNFIGATQERRAQPWQW